MATYVRSHLTLPTWLNAHLLVYLGPSYRCKSKEAAFAELGPVKGILQLLNVFHSVRKRQTVVLGHIDSEYKDFRDQIIAGQYHLAFQAKISDRNHCAQRKNSYCRNMYFKNNN